MCVYVCIVLYFIAYVSKVSGLSDFYVNYLFMCLESFPISISYLIYKYCTVRNVYIAYNDLLKVKILSMEILFIHH